MSKIFPKILKTSLQRSGNHSGNHSWGKHLKPANYPSTTSSSGYRDIDCIQVTKDVELSVTTRNVEDSVQKSENDSQRPLGGAGREEWGHPEWKFRA
jgi:hypothetical protein